MIKFKRIEGIIFLLLFRRYFITICNVDSVDLSVKRGNANLARVKWI